MSVFHVRRGTPYHVSNSLRGIRRAKREGHSEIDLDLQMTKDRQIVGCHWPRPMAKDDFRDPLRRIPKSTPVWEMTWAQVRRLVAPRGYRIQRIERLLRACARQGIGAVLEPKKPDPRFAMDWTWEYLAQLVDDIGVEARVYSFSAEYVAVAKRHGFKAKVIEERK